MEQPVFYRARKSVTKAQSAVILAQSLVIGFWYEYGLIQRTVLLLMKLKSIAGRCCLLYQSLKLDFWICVRWGRGANMPGGHKWFFVCATDGDGTIYVEGSTRACYCEGLFHLGKFHIINKSATNMHGHHQSLEIFDTSSRKWLLLGNSDDYDKIIKSMKYCGQGTDLKLYTHSAKDIVVLEDGNWKFIARLPVDVEIGPHITPFPRHLLVTSKPDYDNPHDAYILDLKDLIFVGILKSGIKSWFLEIKDVVDEFVSKDRIIWMDIEGVPLKAWSRETFIKIGKKWGETLDLEDNPVMSFGRKRICIKTKHATSILESFKIIVKGKVYMVRAKELFTWNPVFMIHKENDCNSDGGSAIEPLNNNDNEEEFDDEYASDVNEVPDTAFGENGSSNLRSNDSVKAGETGKSSPSLSHPPGFTPEILEDQNDNEAKNTLESLNAKVMGSSQEIPTVEHNDQVSQKGINNRGSVLEVMEDVI
nr:hypothetical protein [Tanacetum cinerariifolium]